MATEKYPKYVVETVRKEMHLGLYDESKDEEIEKMNGVEVLQKVCNYHGLSINVYQVLLWAEMIFGIKIIGRDKK